MRNKPAHGPSPLINLSTRQPINYLAHAYLSFHHPAVLVGNMISDFVKGRRQFDFPADIQHGLRLHRAIDAFTDAHPATREAKAVFRPAYRLYSGAFVDVVYDHFLAADEKEFTDQGLLDFSKTVYGVLEAHQPQLPERFARMFPYMKAQNWLYHYQSRWGTGQSFGGLVRRSRYLTESETALELFEQHYQLLQDCYRLFWADVYRFASQTFTELTGEAPLRIP